MGGAFIADVGILCSIDGCCFSVFDTVFFQTQGANKTETVSILGYHELITRLNIGEGSAISVLIFIMVILIAVLFVKGLGTSTAQQRGKT